MKKISLLFSVLFLVFSCPTPPQEGQDKDDLFVPLAPEFDILPNDINDPIEYFKGDYIGSCWMYMLEGQPLKEYKENVFFSMDSFSVEEPHKMAIYGKVIPGAMPLPIHHYLERPILSWEKKERFFSISEQFKLNVGGIYNEENYEFIKTKQFRFSERSGFRVKNGERWLVLYHPDLIMSDGTKVKGSIYFKGKYDGYMDRRFKLTLTLDPEADSSQVDVSKVYPYDDITIYKDEVLVFESKRLVDKDYKLEYWFVNGETKKENPLKIEVESDVNVEAKFRLKTAATISFNKNGGDSGNMSTLSVKEDDDITLPANKFIKAGNVFVGWAIEPTGYKVYSDGEKFKMGQENLNLYALWQDE